jgi:hypothetical protein
MTALAGFKNTRVIEADMPPQTRSTRGRSRLPQQKVPLSKASRRRKEVSERRSATRTKKEEKRHMPAYGMVCGV